MPCFVYFLFSETTQQFYGGVSNDLVDRLSRHNNGESISSKSGVPWALLPTIDCTNKWWSLQLQPLTPISYNQALHTLYLNGISIPFFVKALPKRQWSVMILKMMICILWWTALCCWQISSKKIKASSIILLMEIKNCHCLSTAGSMMPPSTNKTNLISCM